MNWNSLKKNENFSNFLEYWKKSIIYHLCIWLEYSGIKSCSSFISVSLTTESPIAEATRSQSDYGLKTIHVDRNAIYLFIWESLFGFIMKQFWWIIVYVKVRSRIGRLLCISQRGIVYAIVGCFHSNKHTCTAIKPYIGTILRLLQCNNAATYYKLLCECVCIKMRATYKRSCNNFLNHVAYFSFPVTTGQMPICSMLLNVKTQYKFFLSLDFLFLFSSFFFGFFFNFFLRFFFLLNIFSLASKKIIHILRCYESNVVVNQQFNAFI